MNHRKQNSDLIILPHFRKTIHSDNIDKLSPHHFQLNPCTFKTTAHQFQSTNYEKFHRKTVQLDYELKKVGKEARLLCLLSCVIIQPIVIDSFSCPDILGSDESNESLWCKSFSGDGDSWSNGRVRLIRISGVTLYRPNFIEHQPWNVLSSPVDQSTVKSICVSRTHSIEFVSEKPCSENVHGVYVNYWAKLFDRKIYLLNCILIFMLSCTLVPFSVLHWCFILDLHYLYSIL